MQEARQSPSLSPRTTNESPDIQRMEPGYWSHYQDNQNAGLEPQLYVPNYKPNEQSSGHLVATEIIQGNS